MVPGMDWQWIFMAYYIKKDMEAKEAEEEEEWEQDGQQQQISGR